MYESAFIPVQYYTKSLFLRLVLFNQLINDNVWPIAVARGGLSYIQGYSVEYPNFLARKFNVYMHWKEENDEDK